jgi:hypothetical protein
MKFLPVIIAIAIATATAHAGPWHPQQVSAEAQWMLHADLDGMRATAIGRGLAASIEQSKGRQLRAFKRMFSVNPLTDLDSVTLYGPGAKDQAVALLEGRFDRAHIEDVIGGADDYRPHDHGGVTVHQWTDQKKSQFAAFAADNRIVFSEREALVHHALDVLAGKAAAAADVPFFTAGPGAPVLHGFAMLEAIEMDGRESKLLRKAQALRLAVAEVDGKLAARAAIDAAEPRTAGRMRRVLDGLAAFSELAELLGGEIDFESGMSNGNRTVEVALAMPVQQFLDLVAHHGKAGDE